MEILMKKALFTLIAFILVSCASSSHRKMRLPSGNDGFLVQCHTKMGNCYDEANKVCKKGYDIHAKDTSTSGGVPVGNTFVVESRFEMLISCK